MKSSFAHFDKTSKKHKHNIIQRGYIVNEQLFHTTSVLRRIYRTLFNRPFEGWRTYWKAQHRDGRHCFVKVYFGHDDPKVNLISGVKQVKLTRYFSNTLMHVKNVSLPHIEDHWVADDIYFVALSWRNIQTINLCALFKNTKYRLTIYALVEALSRLQPPDWWNRKIETHNFALTNYDIIDSNLNSPFDADFIRNIAIDDDDKIYFYDFEKFQWSKKGLMESHLLIFCYLQYLRGQLSLGEQAARDLIIGFSNQKENIHFDQSISIIRLMLKNTNEPSITSLEMGELRSLINGQSEFR